LLTIPTLGWPLKEVSHSVPEEISKTVVETVEVPVQVTRWRFLKTTKMETHDVAREVKETVFHSETRQEFSVWLFLAMAVVGCLCYLTEIGVVRLLWRWFG
jgi:hypothetical protein